MEKKLILKKLEFFLWKLFNDSIQDFGSATQVELVLLYRYLLLTDFLKNASTSFFIKNWALMPRKVWSSIYLAKWVQNMPKCDIFILFVYPTILYQFELMINSTGFFLMQWECLQSVYKFCLQLQWFVLCIHPFQLRVNFQTVWLYVSKESIHGVLYYRPRQRYIDFEFTVFLLNTLFVFLYLDRVVFRVPSIHHK